MKRKLYCIEQKVKFCFVNLYYIYWELKVAITWRLSCRSNLFENSANGSRNNKLGGGECPFWSNAANDMPARCRATNASRFFTASSPNITENRFANSCIIYIIYIIFTILRFIYLLSYFGVYLFRLCYIHISYCICTIILIQSKIFKFSYCRTTILKHNLFAY